jgi:hypothetical protein
VQKNASSSYKNIKYWSVNTVLSCDNVSELETNEIHASNASQSAVVLARSTVVYRHKKNSMTIDGQKLTKH